MNVGSTLVASDLNVKYCACFEQRAPWHSGNYKTHMWHNKNTQLKTFLPLQTVSLRHLRFYMNNSSCAQQKLDQSNFYSLQKIVSCLSSHLLWIHKKNHTYLTDSQYWRNTFAFICHTVNINRSIFLVSSLPSLIT